MIFLYKIKKKPNRKVVVEQKDKKITKTRPKQQYQSAKLLIVIILEVGQFGLFLLFILDLLIASFRYG